MGFFSFLRRGLSGELPVPGVESDGYVPSFWEDDYCQVEIVPAANGAFIKQQIGEIEDFSAKASDNHDSLAEASDGVGFTDIFLRGQMPTPTLSMELRADYWEATLTSFGLQRARRIRFDGNKILNCETGDTRAFGFASFTIFFDRQGEFVKNIWIDNGPGLSAPQLDAILAALYALGEECALVLADWNLSAFVDLADRRQIEQYLRSYEP